MPALRLEIKIKIMIKILCACGHFGDKDKNNEKRYCVPALISEKEAPHSTPGSLDPLRCSTPKISSWYFSSDWIDRPVVSFGTSSLHLVVLI